MLQERFTVSLTFRHALESAAQSLHQQQELVASLEQSFLESVSRFKVSGEDPLLFLATLSQAESSIVYDYDNFSLLASFFGWDCSLNLSTTNPRSLAKWIEDSSPAVAESCPLNLPIESAGEVGPSGLSSEEKDTLGITRTADVLEEGSSIQPSPGDVLPSTDAEADADPDSASVPAPEEFNDLFDLELDQSAEESRTFFPFLLVTILILLFRGC